MTDQKTMNSHCDPSPRAVVWPPQILSVTDLGYIRDVTGNYYPRDIGRSTVITPDLTLFQFGDTFCHNMKKEFVGVTDNTCAIVQHHAGQLAPTLTRYTTQYKAGRRPTSFNGEAQVTNLIEKDSKEKDTATGQFKLWAFGGLVERYRSSSTSHLKFRGWAFYDASIEQHPPYESQYQYTGIADVTIDGDEVTAKAIERIRGSQCNRQLFASDEPRFGSFCAIERDDMVYAYGHSPDRSKNIVLAKVHKDYADDKTLYTYWNGKEYTPLMDDVSPVLINMQHGQIFPTKMFNPHGEFEFAFIGCNAQGDSKIQMGRAQRLEGPWHVVPLDVKTYHLNDAAHAAPFRYCMYPHPWASDISKGDLMISWSEGGMTGGVIAVQVRFTTRNV